MGLKRSPDIALLPARDRIMSLLVREGGHEMHENAYRDHLLYITGCYGRLSHAKSSHPPSLATINPATPVPSTFRTRNRVMSQDSSLNGAHGNMQVESKGYQGADVGRQLTAGGHVAVDDLHALPQYHRKVSDRNYTLTKFIRAKTSAVC